jgi:hypothetical protein
VVYAERLRLSPHFEALLKKSKNHGELYLPDSSAYLNTKNVKIYIHFLYTSTLATEVTGTENDLGFLRAECELLGELYRLGLVFEDPRFRNAVLDVILEISRLKGKDGVSHLPHPGTFSNLPHDSPARRCIVDLYVHFLDPEDPAIDRPENKTFMLEVFKAAIRRCDVKSEHGGFRRQNLRRCDYHDHEDGVRCDDGDDK